MAIVHNLNHIIHGCSFFRRILRFWQNIVSWLKFTVCNKVGWFDLFFNEVQWFRRIASSLEWWLVILHPECWFLKFVGRRFCSSFYLVLFILSHYGISWSWIKRTSSRGCEQSLNFGLFKLTWNLADVKVRIMCMLPLH